MVKYKFKDIAINSTLKKKPVEDDKYHYIGLEHLDSGSLQVTRYGSEVAPKGEKLIMKKGDVLFGKRRAYQKKVGIAPFDGIFSAHGMVLRPKEDVVDKDFFPLFINSDYFLDAAIKISVGSLSPTINWGDLKELEFELPGLDEQRKLAKILWAAEETKQAYKTLLQKTDDLVKAKFEEMFGNNDTYRTELNQYAEILGGYAFKSKQFISNEVPVIRISNINNECIIPDKDTCYNENFWVNNKNYRALRNDILMAMSGATTGKSGFIDTDNKLLVNQRVAIIRAHQGISPNFLYQGLRLKSTQDRIQYLAMGCAQPNISLKQIGSLFFPKTTLEEQNNFERFSKQLYISKANLQKSLDCLNATMRALINENLK